MARKRGKATKRGQEGDPSTEEIRTGEWGRESQRPGERARKMEHRGRHNRHRVGGQSCSRTSLLAHGKSVVLG